jgi:DNA topoisomerase-1
MYKLVIVESPAKCKKIEQYLNSANKGTYKCIASYGHIRELPGLAAINIHNNFAPTFIECESKKDQIGKIRKAMKDADEVILATDDDREGEAIAWHLCEVFNLPVELTKRIIFHEITEPALHKALALPINVNMAVVHAQIARQVLDMLVGYHLSPLLWKHVKDGLSAGRCQTPALRLIYENERAIQATPGKQSYVVTGYFTNKMLPFTLNHAETCEEKMQVFLQESLTTQ